MSIDATFDFAISDGIFSISHDWLNDDDVSMGTSFHCEVQHRAWLKEQLGLFLTETQWSGAEFEDGGDVLKAVLGGDFDRGDPWLMLENRRPRDLPRGGFSTLRLNMDMAKQLHARL